MNTSSFFRKVSIATATVILLLSTYVKAQPPTFADSLDGKVNTINTAVPFLRIAPDARAAGFGDAGVAMSPDANAIFWNGAKIPFADKQLALSVTYTPWLRELVNDIYLATLGGYYKIDPNQAVSFGLRYFSLGSITFTNASGQTLGDFNPKEWAINAGYSRKLSEHFGTGLNLGFVYSNLAAGFAVNNVPIKPGTAVMADISFYYTHKATFGNTKGSYNIAATVANIGNKITYTESAENKDFLPCNLGLGGDVSFQFDQYNKLSLELNFNKLLVPTPDTAGNYRTESTIQGIFKSFGDAPGGFQEELQEIDVQGGVEYWYKSLFSVRGGYFYENKNKGGRQFLTAGLGIKYNVFGLNFSYLIPTSSQKNPLDNTLRFSLLFDFDNLKGAPQEAPTDD